MLFTLISLALAAPPASTCETVEAADTSLLYDYNVDVNTFSGYTDGQVVSGLFAAPNDETFTRIATVRTMLWANTFAYRLDGSGNVPAGAGTWRVGTVGNGKSALDVIHWQDIDDNSWTVYFDKTGLCATTYEN